jgi:hypothetical protein
VLADDLASALESKAIVLKEDSRWEDALACYDQAIAIREELVRARGRDELTEELIRALVGKALVFEDVSQWQDALACNAEAFAWSKACDKANMPHLAELILHRIRYQLRTILELRRWEEAAMSVIRLLDRAIPLIQADSPPESAMREVEAMLGPIRDLPEVDRAALDAALGDDAEAVRSWVGH